MHDFWHTAPGWLVGVVGVGIAINLISAYLKPATDRWIGSTIFGLKFRLPFGAKILEPSAGVMVHGATTFKGRYRFTFGARFAVYRYDGQAYWPQTPVEYDRTQKRWSVSVYVADEPNQPQAIILAAITSDLGNVDLFVADSLIESHGLGCFQRPSSTFVPVAAANASARTATRSTGRSGPSVWIASELSSCNPEGRVTMKRSRSRCSPPTRIG